MWQCGKKMTFMLSYLPPETPIDQKSEKKINGKAPIKKGSPYSKPPLLHQDKQFYFLRGLTSKSATSAMVTNPSLLPKLLST